MNFSVQIHRQRLRTVDTDKYGVLEMRSSSLIWGIGVKSVRKFWAVEDAATIKTPKNSRAIDERTLFIESLLPDVRPRLPISGRITISVEDLAEVS